jgi:hypothetical protein
MEPTGAAHGGLAAGRNPERHAFLFSCSRILRICSSARFRSSSSSFIRCAILAWVQDNDDWIGAEGQGTSQEIVGHVWPEQETEGHSQAHLFRGLVLEL